MKRQITLSFALIFCPIIAFAAPKTTVPTIQAQPQVPNLSFIIATQYAKLQAKSGNTYHLTLYGVSPYIRYYTQRPGRDTGLAQMQNFIASWNVGGNKSLKAVNPNVVLYAGKINSADNDANRFTIGIMSNPSYNAAAQQFSLDVTPLDGQRFLFNTIDYEDVSLVIN